MIAIVNYGVGNLFSLCCSLEKLGAECVVTSDLELIDRADKIILPGVGAFREAADKINKGGFRQLLIKKAAEGVPILGICLGMQLLFEKSYEHGEWEGLGLIPGEIVSLGEIAQGNKIPQMGWNRLCFTNKTPIFDKIKDGDYVYFVHSYYAKTEAKYITSTAKYGGAVTASVEKDKVFGCQFHPEKSGDVGLAILQAFVEM